MLPARRSTPEHDPYMTSKHSTTARWIKLGVDFDKRRNANSPGNKAVDDLISERKELSAIIDTNC